MIKVLKKKIFKTGLLYTIFFTIISSVMVFIFLNYNKGFIWNGYDGTKQHIVTLSYFRNLLIDFLQTGKFLTFTWNIAAGIDMYGNLTYYILGDVFSYISVLFPAHSLEKVYSVLVIVRMYCVGLAFLWYCNYHKCKITSSVIGALLYTFCSYSLFASVRHPYFTNALILFPLVMGGLEKIVLENKKVFYIFVIAITFISNFYFAYMIAFVIAIYGLVLTVYNYKKDGLIKILKVLFVVLICSVVGILISGIILLPAVVSFLNSERTASSIFFRYDISYYRNLFASMLSLNSAGYWVYSGIGQGLLLIILPIMFKRRKENYPLFLTLVLLYIPLMLPQIASAFCGFGFPNNRWTFVFAFIYAFFTTSILNLDKDVTKKELKYIWVFCISFLFVNTILDVDMDFYSEMQILFLVIFLGFMFIKKRLKNFKLYNFFLLTLSTVSLIGAINYMYNVYGNNYVSQFLNLGALNETVNTSLKTISDFDEVVEYIKRNDADFYRISKYPYNYENVSIIKDYNAIGHFYSITPSLYSDLNLDLANLQYQVSMGFKEFDYRTKINTLLGVKYYIDGSGNGTSPYGYNKINDYDGLSSIYQNDYALPFGVFYNSYITEEEYDKLSPLEKESCLLKNIILNDKINKESMVAENNVDSVQEILYDIEDESNILEENEITINTKNENSLKIKLNDIENKELYIYFENLTYVPYSKEEMIDLEIKDNSTLIDIANIQNKYKWYERDYSYKIKVEYNGKRKEKSIYNFLDSPYYIDVNDFLFSLGYYEDNLEEVTITFSKVGTYSFDSIKVLAVSFDDYADDINSLRNSNFVVTDWGNSYLNGSVSILEDGVLQFQTLYNDGFKVFVDGKEVETFNANKYFLGINILKGYHKIEIKYHNSYVTYGCYLSAFGLILLCMIIIYEKLKK